MSTSKHRLRRPLREGIHCATCRQPASRCRCAVFFLDPALNQFIAGTAPSPEPDPGFASHPFVEGTLSPISSSSIDTCATPASPTALPIPPKQQPVSPATSRFTLRRPRARRSGHVRVRAVVLPGILLLSLLLGLLLFLILPAPATIAIRPTSGARDELITVTAVTADPAPLQGQAHVLTSTRTSPALVVKATGVVHQPATTATGKLIFYNIAPQAQQIPAGIVFSIAGGMQVISDSALTLPPGNPPDFLGSAAAPAHVLQAGAQGNIAADTINGLCPCGNGVSVKNTRFSGGQDALSYSVLTPSDIGRVADPERAALLQQATNDVKAQIRRAERLAANVLCTSHQALDHQVGSRTTQGQVTITVTCQGEEYDQQDIEGKASAIFRQDIRRTLPKADVLAGSPIATITHTAFSDQRRGTLTFLVHVKGWWMYALDAAQLSQEMAGKTYNQALSLLHNTPGIENASVQQRGNGWLPLPNDPRQITIRIIPPQTAA